MTFNIAKQLFAQADIDLLVDDIKVALLTNAHTTDIDAQQYFSDISANEASGTGYTAGGQLLSNKSVVKNDTNDQGVFDADDTTWAASTITARYAVIYKDTGTAATSPLIAIVDFTSDQASTANSFTIQWSVNGILTLT
jgi:hypothetical protein